MVYGDKEKTNIKSKDITICIDNSNGLINELISQLGNVNISDKEGFGGIRYTLKKEDIKTDMPFVAYNDNLAVYDKIHVTGNSAVCENTSLNITTCYTLNNEFLSVKSSSKNEEISQYGIDLNFNFLGKKNGTCKGQILPTSPYSSPSGKLMYYIMSVIGMGFCVVSSDTPNLMWKIDYSPYSFGHYINGFQIMSSTDRLFNHEGEKNLEINIFFAESIDECFEKISKIYKLPIAVPKITGSFKDNLTIDIIGNADTVKTTFEKNITYSKVEKGKALIHKKGYGRHYATPYEGEKEGIGCDIWFATDIKKLFEKSCDAVKKPYHGDDNLCEGMIWCLSMICYMNLYESTKYLNTVKEALKTVMCEDRLPVERQTILPYPDGKTPAYHIYKSKRIQEQFFGISILTEMYKLTKEKKYLDFAVSAVKTVIDNYQNESGAFVSESDYTTVCTPIMPIIDLALTVKETDKKLYLYLSNSAKKVADYLLKRGFDFPTEGISSDLHDKETEEGSVACTALSLLYYCRYIDNRPEYLNFAKEILDFHEYWISYTPDVKLFRSTVRWWETIWEGDADGPAMCAGHAWSIWRAEADYHMGILAGEQKYLVKSLNGFMTNFSKITEDGNSYACYQPDYFTGGGDVETRRCLQTISKEDIPKKYKIAHSYPSHFDNSLSRYVWVRAYATWLRDFHSLDVDL